MAGQAMKFGLPPWLAKLRTTPTNHDVGREAEHALVVRGPPPVAIDITGADVPDGWTAKELAAYQAERDASAMAIVAASMEGRLRPRPRWANHRYAPLRWRG
jgi:hypothetical protein